MSPSRPPTAREKYGGGRRDYDRAYNAARAHDPADRAIRSTRWQRVRLLALKRDAHLCVECRKQGRLVRASDVDHIIPKEQRPDLMFDLDNLQSLCRPHHNAKTRAGA